MLLLAVFGLAFLGLAGAVACYIVLRFAIPGPWGPLAAMSAWIAILVGTSAFIIEVVANHVRLL